MVSSHQNSWDDPMMDHSILDEVIPQTKHPLSATYTAIQIRCSSAQNIKLNYLKFADN
jgi:hypothetical protein